MMTVDSPVMPTDTPTVLSYGSSNILFSRETGYYTLDGVIIAQRLNNNMANFGSAGVTSVAGFSAKADTLSGIIGLAINALKTIKFKADDDALKEKAAWATNLLDKAYEEASLAESDWEEECQ